MFMWLAIVGKNYLLMVATIFIESFCGGLATVAFMAFLMSLCDTRYTATQYALFSSIMTLPGKFVSGFSGVIVDGYGYVSFFIYAAAIGIPAILLVIYLMRRINVDEMKTVEAR